MRNVQRVCNLWSAVNGIIMLLSEFPTLKCTSLTNIINVNGCGRMLSIRSIINLSNPRLSP
jgi:hypothetical protein